MGVEHPECILQEMLESAVFFRLLLECFLPCINDGNDFRHYFSRIGLYVKFIGEDKAVFLTREKTASTRQDGNFMVRLSQLSKTTAQEGRRLSDVSN